jgi:hypothetical protein
MQAYKLKGTIDPSGHLVIHDPIAIPPGDVEVIMWSSDSKDAKSHSTNETSQLQILDQKPRTQVKAFQDLFENTQPAPPDFDPEQARWEALKEKYDL